MTGSFLPPLKWIGRELRFHGRVILSLAPQRKIHGSSSIALRKRAGPLASMTRSRRARGATGPRAGQAVHELNQRLPRHTIRFETDADGVSWHRC